MPVSMSNRSATFRTVILSSATKTLGIASSTPCSTGFRCARAQLGQRVDRQFFESHAARRAHVRVLPGYRAHGLLIDELQGRNFSIDAHSHGTITTLCNQTQRRVGLDLNFQAPGEVENR